MNKGIKVLLTGAGGAGTIEIIRTLKEIGGYYIIAVDASEHSYGLRLADAGYVVPFAIDPCFEWEIEAIIKKEKPDYIVPLVDEEILIIHRVAKEFGIKVLAPSVEFCQMGLDKWLTHKALMGIDVEVPRSWLPSVPFPAIGKPRVGRGSRGLVYNPMKEYDNYIFQEEILGTEYTVSVVVGLDNSVIAVVPKEVVVKKGITFVGITRENQEIDSMCRRICKELKPHGPFNVQLIVRDAVPYVIEINPRYSTTVALTIAAGVHEVDLIIRKDRGETVGPVTFTPNLEMIRYYTQAYI